MSVLAAVEVTLDELGLDAEDAGAAALARRLAGAIDHEESGRTLAELSGRLLAVLGDLGATPAARKAIAGKAGGSSDGGERSKLDELKARRAARQHGATSVDASSS